MAADNHPEYPQERPAIKYIVEQVSKIEDAQACGTGYYKSLSKVLDRLDKTDVALNQLNQKTEDLKKIIDFEGVAQSIDNNTNIMRLEVRKGLTENNDIVKIQLSALFTEVRANNRIHKDELSLLIKRFDNHIADVNNRVIPPLWKIYVYSFVALCMGYAIGKWVI